ncbi:DUF2339 domain-containing protein [Paenibacillus motobuensis]|uniref:DUF2339 domain-containing protein n=1 Tax=Paenibacillus TaxID=44249 RepID=UPI0020422B2D|nr:MULTISPECIES: DUF2339 domain-containing protein [Paenibacillus]MCM3042227.1 DUF2339 domain-containing protein [Paenibacillus lutimineralis]MCM3649331.1 DUF2339 domain-containing protein [Paenibacillus motobuensis]
MEEFKDRLFKLQEQQNVIAEGYEALLTEYAASDLVKENEVLQRDYEEYKQRVTALESRLRQLEKENGGLRQALAEQILDEKLSFIRVSQEKLNTYFTTVSHQHMNRLQALEYSSKQRIQQLYEQADRYLQGDQQVITAKLADLQGEINQRVQLHRQYLYEEERRIHREALDGYESLEAEGVDEHTIKRRVKQNQLEMKIGLNWINKLGILLLIIGMGAAFKYTYSWFNAYTKGAVFFVLGLLMLAGGEWLFRRNKQVFALGLLGGGISVLYGSVFYSYFLLEIINLTLGLVLCVIITAAAALMSLRYQSKTICSFALVGGYLPFFSYLEVYGLAGNAVYVAMGYLFLLNALILLISFRKRWPIVHYISFGLNTLSMIILVNLADLTVIAITYALITFLMYLCITLWVPFRYQSKLNWLDFSLLALNTIISCSIMYSLFDKADWNQLRGLLALIFCVVYYGLGRFNRKYLDKEIETRLLFYGTSLTFSLLVIPFQFGINYMSLGWLIEGIVFSVLGHLQRSKFVERIGWGILALTMGAFVLVDLVGGLFSNPEVDFAWKYSFISIGLLGLACFYGFRLRDEQEIKCYRQTDHSLLAVLKYISSINIWFYLLYEINRIYEALMPVDAILYSFYQWLLFAAITFGLAYGLSKAKILYDRVIRFYSRILYLIGYVLCLGVTLGMPALNTNAEYNSFENYLALVILIAFNVFVFFSGRDLLLRVIGRQVGGHEWIPVCLGVYIFGITTAFLGIQFRLGDVSWLFSLIYLMLAIAYIAYGFRRRYVFIRRMGLGLTLLSTGKMLLFDLSLMTTGSKIIAYFSFGLLLLGISYLYQRVSNMLSEVNKPAELSSEGEKL